MIQLKKIDFILLVNVLFLTVFGLLIIYDASSFMAYRDFEDKYYLIKEQLVWAVIGIIGLIFFSMFNYHRLYSLSIFGLVASIILLVLVFVPGIGILLLGARRWVNTGLFIIQPGEFTKLSLAIYFAAWFSHKEKGRFFAFLLLVGLVLALVMLEPDMGTAFIILSEALILFFLSGGNIFYFFLLLPAVSILSFILIRLEPYRIQRLYTFLNLDGSLEKSSYHVKQILIALGMGGLTGVGLGNSLQKYAYLPETTTDSIFAIIAEELGFLGSTVLILLFILLVWRGFLIAARSKDQFGRLLASGITSFLAVQAIINLGAQTALIPLTGVPLPFISYGGSSLIVDLCSVGILLNIAKQGNIT